MLKSTLLLSLLTLVQLAMVQFAGMSVNHPDEVFSGSTPYAAVAFWLVAKLTEIGVPMIEPAEPESDGEDVGQDSSANSLLSVAELCVTSHTFPSVPSRPF